MSKTNQQKIKQLNADAALNRQTEQDLKEAGFHYLLFKGARSPINLRCPDRDHIHKMTPLEALSEGCPTCAIQNQPETVSLARLKQDVKKQDANLLKSVRKSQGKKRGARGGEKYAI